MNQRLIRRVWERAERRCEYCHMPASGYLGSFHADHIIALACLHCNKHKGPNIAGRNPETGEVVELFHPRRDQWGDHFEWNGADLIGTTTGWPRYHSGPRDQ